MVKQTQKQPEELDENLIALQAVESIAEQGAQKILEIIENEFKKIQKTHCDVYDLFYFGCYFLTILLLRFTVQDRQRYTMAVHELLKEQAEEGRSFLGKVISTSQTNSPEKEKELLKELNVEMNEEGERIKRMMRDVADNVKEMGVYEDSIWQRGEDASVRERLQKRMEGLLIDPFNELIDTVVADMQRKCDAVPDPKFILLIIASVNMGLIAGCGARTYHQSIDDFMRRGLEKLAPLIHGETFVSAALH